MCPQTTNQKSLTCRQLTRGILLESGIVDGINFGGIATIWSLNFVPANIIAKHTCPGRADFKTDIAKWIFIVGSAVFFVGESVLWIVRYRKPQFDAHHKKALLLLREVIDSLETMGFLVALAINPLPGSAGLQALQRVLWGLTVPFSLWPVVAVALNFKINDFRRTGIQEYLKTNYPVKYPRALKISASVFEALYNAFSLGSAGSFMAAFLIDFIYNSTHAGNFPYTNAVIWPVVGAGFLGGIFSSIPKNAWKYVHIPEAFTNQLYFILMMAASTGVCINPALGSSLLFLLPTFFASLLFAIPSAIVARENPYEIEDDSAYTAIEGESQSRATSCFSRLFHALGNCCQGVKARYSQWGNRASLPPAGPSSP